MTNATTNVPRELLERASNLAFQTQHYPLHEDLRAILSATSHAGVDGLEVVQAVAWLNTATKEATTHPVVVMDWDDEKEPVESLMPISQHEAIIDGLRGDVAQLQSMLATVSKAGIRVRTDRDQQAHRIGELEGLLMRVQVSISLDDTEWGYSGAEKYKLLADIRAALSAGKEGE